MQMVINGVGGQGVLFLSKIITDAAVSKQFRIFASETVGMAQRGGSVVSFVKIGNKYNSPMIIPGTADILICLQERELENGKGYLKENGLKYINSDKYFNATKLALESGNPSMANIIFLGYITNDENFPFEKDDIYKILPEKTKKFFDIGANFSL